MRQPLVSIIIRTCQRPDVLRLALDSVKNQTYPNVQAVIVEDGENASEEFLQREYKDLNYIYEATGTKVGRCAAGNRALELAEGEYFNFLDDDDALLSCHVEVLMEKLLAHNEALEQEASGAQKRLLAAYSVAEEHQITVKSKQPYEFTVKRKTIRYNQSFNRMLLYTFNYFPIQTVMFHHSLFDELGGFDGELPVLEDWDLWVRYSTRTDFLYVNKVTSYYHIPAKVQKKQERKKEMDDKLKILYSKFAGYQVTVPVGKINEEMTYVIREYKNKGVMRYLRMFFRVVFLGER